MRAALLMIVLLAGLFGHGTASADRRGGLRLDTPFLGPGREVREEPRGLNAEPPKFVELVKRQRRDRLHVRLHAGLAILAHEGEPLFVGLHLGTRQLFPRHVIGQRLRIRLRARQPLLSQRGHRFEIQIPQLDALIFADVDFHGAVIHRATAGRLLRAAIASSLSALGRGPG